MTDVEPRPAARWSGGRVIAAVLLSLVLLLVALAVLLGVSIGGCWEGCSAGEAAGQGGLAIVAAGGVLAVWGLGLWVLTRMDGWRWFALYCLGLVLTARAVEYSVTHWL